MKCFPPEEAERPLGTGESFMTIPSSGKHSTISNIHANSPYSCLLRETAYFHGNLPHIPTFIHYDFHFENHNE